MKKREWTCKKKHNEHLPYHKILWFDSSPDGRFVRLCDPQMCRFECVMVNPVIKKKAHRYYSEMSIFSQIMNHYEILRFIE